MKEITCASLGLSQCDFVAQAEAAGGVVELIVEHLRTAHQIALPDADTILRRVEDESQLDKGAMLVIQRLREELHLDNHPESPSLGPIALGPPGADA